MHHERASSGRRRTATMSGGRILLVVAVSFAAVAIGSQEAQAVPSFARQTGLACSSCHTVFPELTSFGRAFKLHGYTMQGMPKLEQQGTAKAPTLEINRTFPLSVMFQTSVTRTDATQPGTQNGDVEFPQQLSLFLAGEITPHIGTFIQATYTSTDDNLTLDNTDIRYSNDAHVCGKNLVYGVTLNNNPTVEDLWNSTPVWGWPFATADSAPGPSAAALLDGTLGQEVAGLGGYGLWGQHLYADVTLYRSAQIGGPQPPDGSLPTIKDVAPYWRLAWQQNFGYRYLEVGTYGMFAQMLPNGTVSGATDKYTDFAFDAQYEQPLGENWLSAHATYIYENQQQDASLAAGNASNHNDKLNTFRLDGIYHWRSRVSGSLGYFMTTGTSDALLYSPDPVDGSANGSPNSNGLNAEISYFPWQNVRLSALYTTYFEFNGRTNNYDGSGRSSFDNNTLYVLAWLMF